MLLYKTLLHKGMMEKADEKSGLYQYMLDLLSKSIYSNEDSEYDWNGLFSNAKPIIVTKEYIARPDLISLYAYKTDEYADLICKLNGISNPFELNENMLLLIPSKNKLDELVNKTNMGVSEFINENDNNTDNICQIEKTNKKLLNQKRSPNEATINDNNYIIRKDMGLVFY